METFEEQAIKWLKPFGYSIHSHNEDKTYLMFICYEKMDESYPTITCRAKENTASLSYDGLKYFIGLKSGDIAFKHNDIERYIHVMKHYAKVCESNHPF